MVVKLKGEKGAVERINRRGGENFKTVLTPHLLGKSCAQQPCTWLSPDVGLVKRIEQPDLSN